MDNTYEFEELVNRAKDTLTPDERACIGFQRDGGQSWDGRTLRAYNSRTGSIVGYYDPGGWLGFDVGAASEI